MHDCCANCKWCRREYYFGSSSAICTAGRLNIDEPYSDKCDAYEGKDEYELKCERARQQFAAGPGLPGPEEVYITGIDLLQKED